jgi:hypothetical protein
MIDRFELMLRRLREDQPALPQEAKAQQLATGIH